MMQTTTHDRRIQRIHPLITPEKVMGDLALSSSVTQRIHQHRETIENILLGKDHRLLVVVGPCSIHHIESALEYASLLYEAGTRFIDELYIVMRVYFEKPRTTVGWKGLISDPFLDGSFDINHGLSLARKLLIDINTLGLPTGTEFLDTIIPQYLSDLISWSAIGARTSESQIHRELASGLSMPVGFKNSTDGNIQIAIDGVQAAQHSHHFLGINQQGIPSIISTAGNPTGHIILRGGNSTPNFEKKYIQEAATLLEEAGLLPRLMVDCSHGNSLKNYARQIIVAQRVADQVSAGSNVICSVMLESNLVAGKQMLQTGQPLRYGQSITDECLSWGETEPLLNLFAEAVRGRRGKKFIEKIPLNPPFSKGVVA